MVCLGAPNALHESVIWPSSHGPSGGETLERRKALTLRAIRRLVRLNCDSRKIICQFYPHHLRYISHFDLRYISRFDLRYISRFVRENLIQMNKRLFATADPQVAAARKRLSRACDVLADAEQTYRMDRSRANQRAVYLAGLMYDTAKAERARITSTAFKYT
jgi:hypothetical protein